MSNLRVSPTYLRNLETLTPSAIAEKARELIRRFYEAPVGSDERDREYAHALACFHTMRERGLLPEWETAKDTVKQERRR